VQHGDDIIILANLRLAAKPVESSEVATLFDLGDGVACLEFRTKMNTFNTALLETIGKTLERCRANFSALVIGGDATNFSAGADLRVFLDTVEKGGAKAMGTFLDLGHATFQAVKYAPFPVVGAPSGLALGGGCELLLHCDAIQAHAELAIGLVETRIGVIPGWGGCKEMMLRFSSALRGPVAPAIAAFNLIAPARLSSSAMEARNLGFLKPSDGITMNRSRLLADAKQKALSLAKDYKPPEPPLIPMAGPSGAASLRNMLESEAIAGRATAHDRVVGEALIEILSGGPSADPLKPRTEEEVIAFEREAFLDLLFTKATIERIKHMLETGKPLRN